MVVDFRKNNEHLKCWSFLLMRIDRTFSKQHAAKYSPLYMYRQDSTTKLWTKVTKNIACTKEFRKEKLLCIPLAIHIVQCYFAMMINETFKGMNLCFAQLDDTIIYSESKGEHLDPSDNYWAIYVRQT